MNRMLHQMIVLVGLLLALGQPAHALSLRSWLVQV